MDSKWTSIIESLWERYREGDFQVVDEAEKYLTEDDLPEDLKSLYYVSLSLFCLMANKIEKSENYVQKARELFSPEGQYLDEAGLIFAEVLPYLLKGQISVCKEKLNQIDISSHQLKLLLADCFYWEGKFEKSIELYLEAYSICEKNANLEEDIFTIKLAQARALFRLDRLDEAEEILTPIFKRKRLINDGSLEEVKVLIASELAVIKAFQGKIPAARMFFRTDLDPEKFEHPYKKYAILKTRGIVRFKAGKLEAAKADLEEAISLPIREFEKLEAYLYLGDIIIARKGSKKAREYYKNICNYSELFFAKTANEKLEKAKEELKDRLNESILKNLAAEQVQKIEELKDRLNDSILKKLGPEKVQKIKDRIVEKKQAAKTDQQEEPKLAVQPRIEETKPILQETDEEKKQLELENQELSTMEELPITALLMGMGFLENY